MQKRIIEMDILRGLAILGVVIGHVTAETLYVKNSFLGIFFNQAIRFAVPVFIFLSGMGLSLSQKPYPGHIRFVGQRLRKIIPLYCLWTAIYLFPLSFASPTFAFTAYFKALLTGDASYQLYFIPLIVQFYVLFPFLRRYSQTNAGLLLSFFFTLALQTSHVYSPKSLWFLSDQRLFLNWLFFFILGLWCAPRITALQRRLWSEKSAIFILFLLCLAGLVIEAKTNLSAGKSMELSLSNMRPSVLLYSLVFGASMLSGISWPGILASFFRFLSGISYEIFLAHVFVLVEFNALFNSAGVSKASLTYGLFAFLTVLTVSIIMALVQRYLLRSISRIFYHKALP